LRNQVFKKAKKMPDVKRKSYSLSALNLPLANEANTPPAQRIVKIQKVVEILEIN